MVNGNTFVGQRPDMQLSASAGRSRSRSAGQKSAFSFSEYLPEQESGAKASPAQAGPKQNSFFKSAPAMSPREIITTGQTIPMPTNIATATPEHGTRSKNAVQENVNRRHLQAADPALTQQASAKRNKSARVETPNRYGFGMEDTRRTASGKGTPIVLGEQKTPVAHAEVGTAVPQKGTGKTAAAGQSSVLQAMLAHRRSGRGRSPEFALENVPLHVVPKRSTAANEFVAQQNAPVTQKQAANALAGFGAAQAQMALPANPKPAGAINTAGNSYGAVPRPEAYKRGGENPAEMAVRTASHKRASAQQNSWKATPVSLNKPVANQFAPNAASTPKHAVQAELTTGGVAQQPQPLGSLAAKFESGEEGIAAVGYDAHGGTSYGKYQISSRAGTMKRFIQYLQENAPDLAGRLAKAGPANTGGRSGRMPTEWKQIAAEDAQRFEQLQNDFIRASHFEPAMEGIAKESGVSFERLPEALKEVLFSTAVQHGPAGAVRIVNRALNRVKNKGLEQAVTTPLQNAYEAGKELIKNIYAIRAGQFGSSSAQIQNSVKSRLNQEMHEALNMFGQAFTHV